MRIKIILLLLFSLESLCYAQSDSSYYYFDRTTPLEYALKKVKSLSESQLKDYYWLVYYSRIRKADSMLWYSTKLEDNNNLSPILNSRLLYFKAYYYRIVQDDSLSYKYHFKALNKAEKTNDTLTILGALAGLGQSYNYEENIPYRLDYLNALEKKANEFDNNYYKIVSILLKGNYYLFRNQSKKAMNLYRKTLNNNFTKKDSSLLINTISNIAALYNDVIEKPDSSIYYNKLKLKLIHDNKTFQSTSNYFSSYLNIASAYRNNGEVDKSIEYLKKADSIDIKENILTRKLTIKESLAKSYEAIKDYKMAYVNFLEYDKLKDSLNRDELKKGVAKYDNQQLRIENLESEAKRKQNQNIAIGLGGSLALGSIIALLIFKNTKRKQKLAEQEKEIETQKLTTVLKEQELTAIDAMIEGQEKERQRIANDLHDDLGGLMATVKLHFNALKDKKSPELFDKTNSLIEEAYQKVRSVAHTKNSGVIAKHGLLKSVKEMADKISISNKLNVEVIDYGLDTRLENSLELTIFRIVQELVSNVVKHAKASEITIHITNHNDSLNLMVEDNGNGFDAKQITKMSKGMGLSSIDKRVEHLNGKMTIESEISKGTTVIIDIPI